VLDQYERGAGQLSIAQLQGESGSVGELTMAVADLLKTKYYPVDVDSRVIHNCPEDCERDVAHRWPSSVIGMSGAHLQAKSVYAQFAIAKTARPARRTDLDGEVPEKTSGQKADPAGATLFFEELLASVESLGAIADQHGVNTLTDLMYLQQAILKGEAIEVWPGETAVGEVIQFLPSGKRWLNHTDLPAEWKQHCVRVDNATATV
jgi:hypothetical protein